MFAKLDEVIKQFRSIGVSAVDCSVDSGISQSNIITKIKKYINSVGRCDFNISIHLNALSKSKKDGKTKGVECCVYSVNTEAGRVANKICDNIAALGFTNRGIKARTDLGVLKGITNGGNNILVECFFCDDEDDVNVYNKVGAAVIAKQIVRAVAGVAPEIPTATKNSIYIHNGIDYAQVFDAAYYIDKYTDLQKAIGNYPTALFAHFCKYGMNEGRQGCASFNVQNYRARYSDLNKAFGDNLPAYYRHYITNGIKEGRNGK